MPAIRPAPPVAAPPPVTPGPLVPPRPVAGMESNHPPAYPESLRRRGVTGRVVLRVEVSAEGSPLAVAVAQSSGFTLLDQAAVSAVQGWRFVPASQGGRSVAAAASVAVNFTLAGG